MAIYNLAFGVVVLPLLGALASFLAETQRRAAQICIVFSSLAFVMAAIVLGARLTHAPGPPFDNLITFFAMNPPESTTFASRLEPLLGVHVDALSASFGAAVAFINVAVLGYASNSLRGEATYRRFFWSASLLGFAVAGFVYSPNLFAALFMSIAGSAAVYILASQWWQRPDAAAPARRIFVTLSIGDVALLLATVFTFIKFGSFVSLLQVPPGQDISDPFSFTNVTQSSTAVLSGLVLGAGPRTLVVLGILVLFAAMVRGAQAFFHVWLAETATAPVPVIALCASTASVTGVLLLARMYGVVAAAPHVLTAIALVGAFTAAFAAIICIAQRDILRVGAFAAVMQIGLAFTALGLGGYSQAMFIAFSSLFLIALFFFAAGNIVRVYRTRNIHETGGALARMRSTSIALIAWALGTGGLALGTYYALSAAFDNALPFGRETDAWARGIVVVLLLVTAVAASAYAFRVVVTVCTGEVVRRRGFQHDRVAEVEVLLRRPLTLMLVAAAASVLVGLPGIQAIHSGKLSVPGLTFTRFVFFGAQRPSLPVNVLALLLSLAALGAGIAVARVLFSPQRRERTVASLQRWDAVVRAISRGLFVERLSHRAGQPVLAFASHLVRFDDSVNQRLADAAADGAVISSSSVARFRPTRLALYLTGGVVVVAVLSLLAVLAATGHFWIHTV